MLVLAHSLFLLHSPVLEPDLDLRFVEWQRCSDFDSSSSSKISIEVEFLLEFCQLLVCEVGSAEIRLCVSLVMRMKMHTTVRLLLLLKMMVDCGHWTYSRYATAVVIKTWDIDEWPEVAADRCRAATAVGADGMMHPICNHSQKAFTRGRHLQHV